MINETCSSYLEMCICKKGGFKQTSQSSRDLHFLMDAAFDWWNTIYTLKENIKSIRISVTLQDEFKHLSQSQIRSVRTNRALFNTRQLKMTDKKEHSSWGKVCIVSWEGVLQQLLLHTYNGAIPSLSAAHWRVLWAGQYDQCCGLSTFTHCAVCEHFRESFNASCGLDSKEFL